MSFDLDLQLRESIDGEMGEVIENRTVFFGDRFFVEILVGDFRENPTGVISAAMEIEYDSELIVNANTPFVPEDLITEELPILQTGEVNNETGIITNLGASSLPSGNDTGNAIGINEFEQFSILEFEAVGVSNNSTIDVNVDFEQTGFADGTFPEPETESEFSLDVLVGGLAIDDGQFTTSEGVINGRVVGAIEVRSPNEDSLDFAIINGNDQGTFSINEQGEIFVTDRTRLTQDFNLEIEATDQSLNLTDQATISIEVIPLPFLGTTTEEDLNTIENRDLAFLGEGNDRVDLTTVTTGSRIYGGKDDDLFRMGSNNRTFGNEGDDRFLVTSQGSENRLYGGEGDDRFFVTNTNFIAGGKGIDRFFAGEKGGSIFRGGSDPDFFWIINGVIPDGANIIDDFTFAEDIIRIAGENISFSDLDLTQQNSDTRIAFNNQEIAILTGVEAGRLSDNDFIFSGETFVL